MMSPLKYFETVSCGDMAAELDSAITNGADAQEKAWPWQALINSHASMCGGVLVSDRWILTAAHCFNARATFNIQLGTRVFGSTDKNNVDRFAEVIVKHRGYEKGVYHDDIALIKMNSKVEFTERVRPACLPLHRDEFDERDVCYISGFGRGPKEVNGSTTLQQLRVMVVPLKECVYFWSSQNEKIDRRSICAGRMQHRGGACNGDSGGPLSCKAGDKYYVAGITSFGPTDDCFSDVVPDVFMRVSEYLNWINCH